MSQYTTGELAKECGITVRTVQFYDQKGILVPSSLTEGGRRLYSEEDMKTMKIICFLRDIGLSLDTIGQLLKEEDPGSVISILLEQQEQQLQEEIGERRDKLDRLAELRKGLKTTSPFSIRNIGDIATVMEGKKKLNAVHRNIILPAIPLGILQWGSILLWILKGVWWPFAVWVALIIPYGIWATRYYFRNTAYICPQCHEVFRPAFREMFFAKHTPKTRKLTCTKCGHCGFCVETYGGNIK
ncbi:MAG: MerR family transcriptional regulator [Clostridiales bacterium]|nr:MerR family transcriptional regulator [Clostridiales bacterium]